MSVRVYQLSKKIGMDNNELIDLLTERGFQIKSASSTVDNISADSIIEEFATKSTASHSEDEESTPLEEAPKPVVAPSAASFVRSVEDIAKEKKEAQEAAVQAPAAPAAPKPAAPPPMSPASAKPVSLAPPVAAPPPAVGPPVPGLRPKVDPAAAEAPLAARPAPAAPPPAQSAPPPVHAGPPAPPQVGGPPSPGAVTPPSAVAPTTSASDVSTDEIRTITVKPPIVVRDFATELGLKPFKLISELMEMGIFASINQSLEEDVAIQVAEKHGIILDIRHRGEGTVKKSAKKKVVVEEDESKFMEERPPVVTILGHVDHGKTSLLDFIRKANVVKGEAGGITQHIGAYQVVHNEKKITFLDTPGHAAFNAMRARGANLTDVAILIVAADDGFKPQTDEALKFLQNAGVQPIVAINKIDTKGANIDRVKQQMQERGIQSEDWGGEIITVPISALKGDGIDELLEMILLQAEVLELKANPKKPGEGLVIESRVEIGRGSTATVIVTAGTLKVGDALVCGPHYTKVKALLTESGEKLKSAPPSTPVSIIGWSGTPGCGGTFKTVKNEKVAKREASEAETWLKKQAIIEEKESNTMTPQEKLFAKIDATRKKTLRILLKADVAGSIEAVVNSLKAITSDKVALDIIGSDVGSVTRSDVKKAAAGEAMIVGFGVKNDNGTQAEAKSQGVKIVHYSIIYELIDAITEEMVSMLDPEYREKKIGAAEVRAVFAIAKGFVAGCLVVEGRVSTGANARLIRRNDVVIDSEISNLRRVKDEVKEVRAGTECGINLDRFNDYREGDIIEVYEMTEIRPTL